MSTTSSVISTGSITLQEKAAAAAAALSQKMHQKALEKAAKDAEKAAAKEAKEAEKAANPKRPRGRPAKSSASMVSSVEEDDMVSLSDGARPDLFEPAPYNTNRTAILARLHKAEAALASLRALLTA